MMAASSLDETKEIAKPLVPNRPALPTYKYFFVGKKSRSTLVFFFSSLKKEIKYSMKISFWRFGHIIVEDHVYSFNVNSSTKKVGGNHDSELELFESLIDIDSF
jgi:hypothetical protein